MCGRQLRGRRGGLLRVWQEHDRRARRQRHHPGAAGVPYLVKADLYPGLVVKLHESSVTNTFLYSFRHRGASCRDLGGKGEQRNQYNAYDFGGEGK